MHTADPEYLPLTLSFRPIKPSEIFYPLDCSEYTERLWIADHKYAIPIHYRFDGKRLIVFDDDWEFVLLSDKPWVMDSAKRARRVENALMRVHRRLLKAGIR